MQSFDYLIVGGGLAAASAVDGIRSLDADGSIAILANESEPPYHRPPLSKEFLQTPEATRELLHVKPEGWFEEEAKVTLLNGVRATSLNPKEMTIGTAADETYHGERILLAMGGRPRSLAIPGTELDGVSSFRTVADAERLRDRAPEAKSALLIGAGFIGMELAASLTRFDVASTIVERESRVWSEMLPPVLSYFVQGYFEERGIRFELDAEVEELLGSERLEGARLANGAQVVCDLAVVGVGLRPNEEIAAEAGLAVMDGVIVDRFGESSHGHIYATGDLARFPDAVFGDTPRLEHWDHARAHGKAVGRNMAGAGEPFDHVSYFYSDVFDLGFSVLGRPAGADDVRVLGELSSERSIVVCGQNGHLAGVVLINATDRLEACRELVRERPAMDQAYETLDEAETELGNVTSQTHA
ncbi:MAG: FAD-dependent oxidoreductase [Gemmatimonadales bacterium]